MTLNKENFINSIIITEITPKKARKIFENILENIKSALESGEDVLISGFGKFCVEKSNKRRRNSLTGNDLMLDRLVTFTCSKVLIKKLNKKLPT